MADHDLSGTVLDGRYKVIEPIAEGAMGSVYRGERLKLGRAVAIKVMHQELPDELSSRQRFEREAKLMALLEHPNCVSVIDFGVHEDKPFLVMDLVRGTSLIDLLEKSGKLEPARAAEIIRQVLSGLAHAHELGIVHRDIKPANIMISEKAGLGSQVRILDFGLARLTEGSTKLTTGIVVGTPNYMAPEQCKGSDVDARTDIYACGVMLFEMLTGRKPFLADDPIAVVRKHLMEPPPTLSAVEPNVEFGGFEAVVAKALAKRAEDRFDSAVDMATAVEEVAKALSAPVYARAVPDTATHSVGAQVATASGWAVPQESGAPVTESQVIDALNPNAGSGATITPSQVIETAPVGGSVPPSGPTSVPSAASFPSSGPSSAPASFASGPASFPSAATSIPPSGVTSMPPMSSGTTTRQQTGPSPTAMPPSTARPQTGPSPTAMPPSTARPQTGPSPTAMPPSTARPQTGPSPTAMPPSTARPQTGPSPTAMPPSSSGPTTRPQTGPAPTAPDSSHGQAGGWVPPSGGVSYSPDNSGPVSDGAPNRSLGIPPTRPAQQPGRPTLSPKQIAMVGGGLLAIIVIVIAVVASGGNKADANKQKVDAKPIVVPDEPSVDPIPAILDRGNKLIDGEDAEAAVNLFTKARKAHPDNAQLALGLGRAYFGKLWWSEGVRNFRDAIKLDPEVKSDPEMLKAVLKGFLTTPDIDDRIADFMLDLGEPMKAYLQETADTHPNKAQRARAAAMLRRFK